MEFAEFYLRKGVREVYLRQQACSEHADLILDGTKSPDDLAREVVDALRGHSVQRDTRGSDLLSPQDRTNPL